MNDAIPFAPIETDSVIIGAGPVGLFQVFELGLLGIRAHVVDSLARVGGQCIELYPEKPIYDIPSVPVCTGRELTENLLRQIERFKPVFHLRQEVSVVRRRDDGRFHVETSSGTCFITKTISIAGLRFTHKSMQHFGSGARGACKQRQTMLTSRNFIVCDV